MINRVPTEIIFQGITLTWIKEECAKILSQGSDEKVSKEKTFFITSIFNKCLTTHFLSCQGSRFDPQHEDRQIHIGRKILKKKCFCNSVKLGKLMFKEHPNVTCIETETLELLSSLWYNLNLQLPIHCTVRDLRQATSKNTIYVIFTCSFLKFIYPRLIFYIQKLRKLNKREKNPYFIPVTS